MVVSSSSSSSLSGATRSAGAPLTKQSAIAEGSSLELTSQDSQSTFISEPRRCWPVLASAGRHWASARPTPNLVLAQQTPVLPSTLPAPGQHQPAHYQ
jgi:hypothetical protein